MCGASWLALAGLAWPSRRLRRWEALRWLSRRLKHTVNGACSTRCVLEELLAIRCDARGSRRRRCSARSRGGRRPSGRAGGHWGGWWCFASGQGGRCVVLEAVELPTCCGQRPATLGLQLTWQRARAAGALRRSTLSVLSDGGAWRIAGDWQQANNKPGARNGEGRVVRGLGAAGQWLIATALRTKLGRPEDESVLAAALHHRGPAGRAARGHRHRAHDTQHKRSSEGDSGR